MPKANKHAEVKPSKYKTTLCQFYAKGEACPFGKRCAFAHGDEELKAEEENVALLKSTGLHRLDATPPSPTEGSVDGGASTSAASTTSTQQHQHQSQHRSSPVSPTMPSSTTSSGPRRHPVMVSLPKYGTASERNASPYSGFEEVAAYTQFSYPQPQPQSSYHYYGSGAASSNANANPSGSCHCDFSATCRREQPLVYRHNPYKLGY